MWARLTTLGQHFFVHTHTLMQPYMISEKHFDYMAHTNDKSDTCFLVLCSGQSTRLSLNTTAANSWRFVFVIFTLMLACSRDEWVSWHQPSVHNCHWKLLRLQIPYEVKITCCTKADVQGCYSTGCDIWEIRASVHSQLVVKSNFLTGVSFRGKVGVPGFSEICKNNNNKKIKRGKRVLKSTKSVL